MKTATPAFAVEMVAEIRLSEPLTGRHLKLVSKIILLPRLTSLTPTYRVPAFRNKNAVVLADHLRRKPDVYGYSPVGLVKRALKRSDSRYAYDILTSVVMRSQLW